MWENGGGGVTVYLGDLIRPTNNQTIRTNNQRKCGIEWDFECEQGGKRKRHCVTMIKEASTTAWWGEFLQMGRT